ncbi:hypothetical protein ACOME3_000889 [Neoechinorhynchus agilis]
MGACWCKNQGRSEEANKEALSVMRVSEKMETGRIVEKTDQENESDRQKDSLQSGEINGDETQCEPDNQIPSIVVSTTSIGDSVTKESNQEGLHFESKYKSLSSSDRLEAVKREYEQLNSKLQKLMTVVTNTLLVDEAHARLRLERSNNLDVNNFVPPSEICGGDPKNYKRNGCD